MEALKELGRLVLIIVWAVVEPLLWAIGMFIGIMAVGVWSLAKFTLGVKVNDKGELSYRR